MINHLAKFTLKHSFFMIFHEFQQIFEKSNVEPKFLAETFWRWKFQNFEVSYLSRYSVVSKSFLLNLNFEKLEFFLECFFNAK